MIPVTKPYIPNIKKYFKYIEKANSREWLTNFGPLHAELTSRLENWLGVKNLLLVSNGTLALQIAYKALGISGEVYTTPFSFVATVSSLQWESIKPHYVDIHPGSLNMNSDLLPEKPSKKISGIVSVHVYGNPADMDIQDRYCRQHKLKSIYDGAHAFGVRTNNKSILLAGDATTISFHATKVFHTVEGGAIIFRNKSDIETAKMLINFGFDEYKEVRSPGINAKLNEYQCAVGLTLLDEIDSIINRRVECVHRYTKELADYVEMPVCKKKTTLNGAYFPVILPSESILLKAVSNLTRQGIQTRRYFYPSLNKLERFNPHTQILPVSEDKASRVLCLPMYTALKPSEQSKVISNFLKELT